MCLVSDFEGDTTSFCSRTLFSSSVVFFAGAVHLVSERGTRQNNKYYGIIISNWNFSKDDGNNYDNADSK